MARTVRLGRIAGRLAPLVLLAAAACAGGGAGAAQPAAAPGPVVAAPAVTVVPPVVAAPRDSAAEDRRGAANDSAGAATFLVRGMAEYRSYQYAAATRDFNAALRLQPRLGQAVTALAAIAGDERRYPTALALADSAVALGDTAIWLANMRGRALAGLRRCPEAVAVLAPFLHAHPEWRNPAPDLAYCLLNLGRPKEAVAVMQVAVRGEPRATPLQFALVEAFVATQQLDSALAHVLYLKDHYPENGLWWIVTGRVLVLLNRPDEARIVFEQGFRRRPGLVDSLSPMDRSAWQAIQGLPEKH